MPTAPLTKLLIVDGHAYAYRAFHAIRHLRSPAGAPTNAIYGFIKMLGRMQSNLTPSHSVVVWDGGLAAARMAEHPEYKAQRPPMPSDLEQQFDGMTGYLEAAGIASLCQDGVEADDWIGVLAQLHATTVPVVIASSDKDFMQLVSDRVGILNPNDKTEKVWGPVEVRAKTGLEPAQIVDWLALIGDAVDNIPGVPGVGPKTATDLLTQFGSVDELYRQLGGAAPPALTPRLKASLEASREIVQKNQRLIRLRTDIRAVPLEQLAVRASLPERLASMYAEWGFKTMLAQLTQGSVHPGSTEAGPPPVSNAEPGISAGSDASNLSGKGSSELIQPLEQGVLL